LYERFTKTSRHAVAIANRETHRLGGNIIGDVELLLGLVTETGGVANAALRELAVDLPKLKDELERQPRSRVDGAAREMLPQTPEFKLAIQSAIELAREMGHQSVGTQHMLLAVLRDRRSVSSRILRGYGVSLARANQTVVGLMSANPQAEE